MKFDKTSTEHLNHATWQKANLIHIRKVISEFAHESIIEPELLSQEGDWEHFRICPNTESNTEYRFDAKKLQLFHWYIRTGSIQKWVNGKKVELDSMQFILEFQDKLGISNEHLPGYLEEIVSTLFGLAYMLSNKHLTSSELVNADHQVIEHALTSGHPSFIANNGRIGFDVDDYHTYTPEAMQPIQLVWVAGHKSRAAYNAIDSLPYEELMQQELGTETYREFSKKLEDKGLNPDEYVFLPVHPWQWQNKIATIFAADLSRDYLVLLGPGPDLFSVQQSLRTVYNSSHPDKFYTKMALTVLNMGFFRGMSPYYMDTTPPITTWLKNTLGKDEYLREHGFQLLCEVATVGYRNLNFEQFGSTSPYNRMLSALWRESPLSVTQKEHQLMPMSALLHVDHQQSAFIHEMVKASGISVETWLKKYLDSYLKPLLHCFYYYDMTFMPHGENLILVMENHVPIGVLLKDITEEICVFSSEVPLSDRAKRICMDIPDEIRILNIFVDIFDGFFRFLTQILEEHCQFSNEKFWKLVAHCVSDYQSSFPDLQEKFERFDLFAPEFVRSCLNRLQLRNHLEMVNVADPLGLVKLQYVGTLPNPIGVLQEEDNLMQTV